jgi:type I restriction enzyme, S subunit
MPPTALLEVFGEVAGSFERQTATLQRQSQNLRRTRDLLLPRLLSGQIDIEAIA